MLWFTNTNYSTATSCHFGNWRYCKETCGFRNQRRRCNCCSSKNVHEPFLRPQSCRWKFGRNVSKARSRLSRKLGLRHRNLILRRHCEERSNPFIKLNLRKIFRRFFVAISRFHYSLFLNFRQRSTLSEFETLKGFSTQKILKRAQTCRSNLTKWFDD